MSLAAPNVLGVVGAIAAGVVLYWLATSVARGRNRAPYPPGPAGWPLIGSLSIPMDKAWLTYRDWSSIYGSDVIRLHVMGMNIIILNSLEAAVDLMDKRSTIYSDRPQVGMTMVKELCGLAWSFILQPYGAEWREGRKAFHREFQLSAVKKYRPVELKETHRLLGRLLRTPDDFITHIRLLAGAEIIDITYGIDVQDGHDPYITVAEHALDGARQTAAPGTYLVDALPFLKYVPEWFPGAYFQTQARLWRNSVTALRDRPWDAVKKRLREQPGVTTDCVAESLMEYNSRETNNPAPLEWISKCVTGTMYLAGSETSYAGLVTFFLAMVLYPDVLKKAQQAVDAVCEGRLPEFSDYDSLPYVHALVKETLRWNPTVPLNLAHRCEEDDIYKGYLIPAGSIVIANNWAFLYDSDAYKEPEKFNPERFLKRAGGKKSELVLDPSVRDPADVGFGYGRRICPGRFMAYEAMWIAIASVLAVFDIEAAKDKDGKPILPPLENEVGFTSQPKPFPCVIKPRSPEHEALIVELAAR